MLMGRRDPHRWEGALQAPEERAAEKAEEELLRRLRLGAWEEASAAEEPVAEGLVAGEGACCAACCAACCCIIC